MSAHVSACHHTCPRVIKRIWTADVTRVVSEAEDTEYGGCCPRPPHYITAGEGGEVMPSFRVSAIPYTPPYTNTGLSVHIN